VKKKDPGGRKRPDLSGEGFSGFILTKKRTPGQSGGKAERPGLFKFLIVTSSLV
jgi:hypothetical protein